MNRTPEQATTTAQPPVIENDVNMPIIKNENVGKIKTVIIVSIILVIIILGAIIGLNFYNKKKAQDQAGKDQIITNTIFNLRNEATTYYVQNKSYQNWVPSSEASNLITASGSTLYFKKPDYQNYIMYAFIPSHNKYLCIDTTGFAEEIAQINEKQVKCN